MTVRTMPHRSGQSLEEQHLVFAGHEIDHFLRPQPVKVQIARQFAAGNRDLNAAFNFGYFLMIALNSTRPA